MKTKWIKPVLWASIVIVAVILVALVLQRPAEGFADGTLPSSTNAPPADSAGATTADPTVALAQDKDRQSLMATFDKFTAFYNVLPATEQMNAKNTDLMNAIEQLRAKSANMTLEEVNAVNAQYEAAMKPAAVAEPPAPPADVLPIPTTVAGLPGVITLAELRDLVMRIQAEKTRLTNLRSSSPTLLARIEQLEKLDADVGAMITDVEQGKQKLEDVPIRPEDARAFLAKLPNTGIPLSTLISPAGTTETKTIAASTDVQTSTNADVLQGLLSNAQYLKWQVNVEYDPAFAERARILNRLEMMEKRLTALLVSETPIPKEIYDAYFQELKTLQSMLLSGKQEVASIKGMNPQTLQTEHTRIQPDVRNDDEPMIAAAAATTVGGRGIMNDDMIARRASSSAFDDSLVGGPDYKERALNICRQIQGAKLGDPANFGCISNPDAVSPTYSWKGNYSMVCNRLGDTWGGWYPEMFGCASYDPTSKFKSSQ